MLHLLEIWVKSWHFRGIERAGLGLAGNVKMVGRVKRAIRAEKVVRWELRWTGAIARLWLYSVQLLRSDINPLLQILKYQPSHRLQARNLQKNCGWGSLISKPCDRCAGTIRRYQLLAIVVSTQLYTTLLLRSSSCKTRYSTKSEKAQTQLIDVNMILERLIINQKFQQQSSLF